MILSQTSGGRMSDEIDRKMKTALDETRLLILGVRILLGFQFQCVFQDRFDLLAEEAKALNLGALSLIVLSIAILIAPLMQHRIVVAGQSTIRLILVTNRMAGAALVPLIAGFTLSAFVVVDLSFCAVAGTSLASLLACASAFSWFGLELLVVSHHQELRRMQPHHSTSLQTK